jgi:hypothetical protein
LSSRGASGQPAPPRQGQERQPASKASRACETVRPAGTSW